MQAVNRQSFQLTRATVRSQSLDGGILPLADNCLSSWSVARHDGVLFEPLSQCGIHSKRHCFCQWRRSHIRVRQIVIQPVRGPAGGSSGSRLLSALFVSPTLSPGSGRRVQDNALRHLWLKMSSFAENSAEKSLPRNGISRVCSSTHGADNLPDEVGFLSAHVKATVIKDETVRGRLFTQDTVGAH